MDTDSITRRQLLAAGGLGAAALALGRPQLAVGSPELATSSSAPARISATGITGTFDDGTDLVPGGLKGDPRKVIVIGAGFAGLAAANALREAGVPCVVLEARNRIGGRIDTREVAGTPVDLGASWVHEPEGNPMKALAAQAGLSLLEASPELDVPTVLFHDDRTGTVKDSEKIAAFLKAQQYDGALDVIADRLGPRASARDGAERFLDDLGLQGDVRRRAGFMIRLYVELEAAKSWEHLPLREPPGRIARPTPNHAAYTGDGLGDFPSGGYRRIIEALAAGTDIRLNHPVERVHAGEAGVRVTAWTGSGRKHRKRVFAGSHVLVTVPLGVLKQRAIRFTPGLPKGKAEAIRSLGVGNLEKVALAFPEPFWEAGNRTHMVHLDAKNPSWFPLFIDLQRIEGRPVLVALNAGATAHRLVGAGRLDVPRRAALKVLREVYGTIPEPAGSEVSAWMLDRYAYGSYSTLVRRSTGDERVLLSRPAQGRILFAGEATNLDGRASTADGAFSSGIREAKRLLGTPAVTIGTPA